MKLLVCLKAAFVAIVLHFLLNSCVSIVEYIFFFSLRYYFEAILKMTACFCAADLIGCAYFYVNIFLNRPSCMFHMFFFPSTFVISNKCSAVMYFSVMFFCVQYSPTVSGAHERKELYKKLHLQACNFQRKS